MLNATPRTQVRHGLVLETRLEYGRTARRNRGWHAGAKVHALWCEYVIGLEPGAQLHPVGTIGARFLRTGKPALYSVYPACMCTQGQMAGMPMKGFTADHVTCTSARRGIEA